MSSRTKATHANNDTTRRRGDVETKREIYSNTTTTTTKYKNMNERTIKKRVELTAALDRDRVPGLLICSKPYFVKSACGM